MVPMLDHQPTCKASGRAALWPVMEGWRARQWHFSIVPARPKLLQLSSVLMEEEAFTGCRLPPEALTQFLLTQCHPCRHQALRTQLLLLAFSSHCLAENGTTVLAQSPSAEDLRVLLKQFYPILQRKKMAHRVLEWQFKTTKKQSGAHSLSALGKTQEFALNQNEAYYCLYCWMDLHCIPRRPSKKFVETSSSLSIPYMCWLIPVSINSEQWKNTFSLEVF